MIRYLIVAAALYGTTNAQAEIHVETECYVRVPAGKDSKPTRMAFRRYVDQDLKKEVGAFVQHDGSTEIIPLVLARHVSTDTDSPGLGNYEATRTGIVGKKPAGEYTFVQTGAGNTQGKYVRYTNAKTGKAVVFQHTGDDDSSCKIMR
ncbi:hypothetical protein [Pseudoduganella buxea]|uniref:Uncharacterized protein n=1 Tax=Pseudoduganella buxea TaxID=1949069 RepID=A0A6I3STA7_9BURK|nr:hypothetical protein [Pseudoduganella buxea]MTV52378.1 hypothetical protein [Pseudoduganella buxea]GGC06369.1 hypothetical protein GCM10011572_30130 [Pseudoduganella buxea]